MKKSKFVAVLVISAMLFTAVPSSAAWAQDSGYFWGNVGVIGGAIAGGALAFFTGGAAIPFLVGGALAGGAVGAVADGNTDAAEDIILMGAEKLVEVLR